MENNKTCYILTGHNPKTLYRVGLALSEENFQISFDFNISWYKDSQTISFLDKLTSDINRSEETRKFYLVGSSFSNHFDYINQNINCEVKKVFLNSDFQSFCDDVLKDFGYEDNPFLEVNGFRCFPNYEFDCNYSFKDYFRKYFEEVQNRLDSSLGEYFLEEDFRNKRKVNSLISDSLGVSNSFYSVLSEFIDLEFDLLDFYESNKKDLSLELKSSRKDEILLVSFVRPSEFQMFQRQAYEVLNAITFRNIKSERRNLEISWRVHLDLSDFYVDWEESDISKDLLYSSFYELKGELEKYMNVEFSCFGGNIHGCNDLRRDCINDENKIESFGAFVWLDPDVIFPRRIFYELDNFFPYINENFAYYGLSPEFLYSESNYLKPLVTSKVIDDERVSFQDLEFVNQSSVSLEKIETLPICGSFSVVSTPFLDLTGMPDELGYYGNDDRYISECFRIFNKYTDGDEHVLLYKMKNLVVTQIKEGVKRDNAFLSYFSEGEETKDKHARHQKTQDYLDTLFERFSKKIEQKFDE